jgi:radical SAM superfamily enzyme YgiQ (UPF0313 family)
MPGQKDMSRVANIMPPLGLCSLAAWLERHGHPVAIHDCYAHPLRDERLLERLRRERPDFLGLSTTTSSFLDGVRIAALAKQELQWDGPNMKVTNMPEANKFLRREYRKGWTL